jgi:hypothetical protein
MLSDVKSVNTLFVPTVIAICFQAVNRFTVWESGIVMQDTITDEEFIF